MTNPASAEPIVPALRSLRRAGAGMLRAAVVLAVAMLLTILVLPLVALFVHVPPAALVQRLATPIVAQALVLSVVTSAFSTLAVIVLGLPVAYLLATRRRTATRWLTILIDLPMVLPPTVAGLGLLLAFGRAGLLGKPLAAFGITLPFTTLAVILAQVFVAGPFFINAARAGFEAIDPRYEHAAATLRASPLYTFFRVLLPLNAPALLAGAAMTWARALGEFGATITFAGNMPGRTQTLPLAVYVALQSDLEAAVTMSVLLVVVSCALLIGLRALPPQPYL